MSCPRLRTVGGWSVAPGSRDVPLIIAHRGWSSDAPENTLQFFQLALDLGADGVELAELQSLDAGSWFDKKFEGARAPSLQEVFDATGDSPTPSWPASTRWPWPPSLGWSHR